MQFLASEECKSGGHDEILITIGRLQASVIPTVAA
jgi:hypothetical protein